FFRDAEQLAYLRNTAFSQLIEARRRQRSLRIWSAACSTGEEPYTLAILLHQTLGERLPDWRIEILGTDVSARALAAAEQARYTDDAIRAVDPVVRVRYFRQDGPFWTIDPLVRSLVSFDIHNLKDRLGAKRYGAWDAIVCRNALIYFDDAMRARVAAMFADQLSPGGWLAVGASESLESLDIPLTAEGDGPARLYRPAIPASAHTAETPAASAKPGMLRLA
ncbi:MAG TPA: CheR family methyltransferase, partial [Phycisphaerales bacterium]|nr:CheR family methyltransferase [Phycisphaerales bacterium]